MAQQVGQNGDDGDDDEQFNEGEPTGLSRRARDETRARRFDKRHHGVNVTWELVLARMFVFETSAAVIVCLPGVERDMVNWAVPFTRGALLGKIAPLSEEVMAIVSVAPGTGYQ